MSAMKEGRSRATRIYVSVKKKKWEGQRVQTRDGEELGGVL